MPEINSLTSKTTWDDTDSVPIADAGGVVKRYLLSVLRKIIPATDSATAFQVMKADNTTAVVTVDSLNDRVGINVPSPGVACHLRSRITPVCYMDAYTDTSAGAYVHLRKARGSDASPSAILSGDTIGRVYFSGYEGDGFDVSAYISVTATENWTPSARGASLSFITMPTGTTTSRTALVLNATGTLTAGPTYSATVGGTNRDLYIDSTGLIGYVSSIRESKTDIESLGETDWVFDLTPRKFYYRRKDDKGKYTDEKDGDLQYGLIYDEVEKVNPDLCFFDIDENGAKIPRGVNYSKLVPALLDQLQKQKARIDALEARLNKAGI